MAKEEKAKKQDLTSDLKKLSEISEWFEDQEEIDVEKGLKKVKEAAALIKSSKKRLEAIENEFEEIKKEVDIEDDDDDNNDDEEDESEKDEENIEDIPF